MYIHYTKIYKSPYVLALDPKLSKKNRILATIFNPGSEYGGEIKKNRVEVFQARVEDSKEN